MDKTLFVIDSGVAEKRPDTVGHPQSAEKSASHMQSLPAQKYYRFCTVKAAV